MTTTFNTELYKLFDMLWRIYIPPQARTSQDGRFMEIFERASSSYDPTKGSARHYFRNSIIWNFRSRAKTYNNNAEQRANYLRHVESGVSSTYGFQDDLIRSRTLAALIKKAELTQQELRVLHLYLLNPKEPGMREVASLMQLSSSRIDQLAHSVRAKLSRAAERSENADT